jgi:exopolysaccharide biosynthesis polyprenyl glycosylphosphotransferase
VFSRQIRKTRPLFLIADIFLVSAAFEGAYLLRSGLALEREFYLTAPVRMLLLLASLSAWSLAALWTRTYDAILSGRLRSLFWLTLRQCLTGVLAVLVVQYLGRLDLSRPFLALLGALSFLLLALFRLSVRLVAGRFLGSGDARRHVLIVGTGPRARAAAGLILDARPFGLHLAGFLEQAEGEILLPQPYPVFPLSALPEILRNRIVDEIVLAVDSARLSELEDLFLLCDEEGVRTRLDLSLFPHVNSKVSLEHLAGRPMLTFAGAPHDDPRLLFKRMLDFSLAAVALAVLSPLLLLIAALIRATSPGRAIFRQQRCGLNGRRFTLLKFRTMQADAEDRKAGLAHLNVKQTAFKIPNDPRLTPLGRWLRKFSLDELPQLWNIVRGEMSIVGPRPAVESEVENYQPWQRRRLRMRPGLTCLWTLAGRDGLSFDEWMRLDLDYIDNWSLRLDLSILLRTIPIVLSGRGAH